MLDCLIGALQQELHDRIVSGGLVRAIVGIILAALRNLPGQLRDYGKRALGVTAVIDSRNDLFNACLAWLNDLRYFAAAACSP
jgi:hypothetical protein